MILESILPCTYLLLTSGHCLYTLKLLNDHSYCLLFASVGIATVCIRSANVVIYKYFFKTYTIHPEFIEEDEEANRLKICVPDQILGNVSMSSLIWSIFCNERHPIVGACIVLTVSACDVLRLRHVLFLPQNRSMAANRIRIRSLASYNATSDIISLLWMLFGGFFAWVVENNYALVANFPYMITTVGFPVEGFYQGWTLKRSINNYMMMAYIVLMTEALCHKSRR